MDDHITTFSGLVAFALILLLKDWLFSRKSEPREKGKADNLDEQTVLMREMVRQKKKRGVSLVADTKPATNF